MVNADLGACEWFIYELRRSSLIDRGQLDQVVGDYLKKNPRAEPPALADYLVQQNILTQFQAERILQGKTQGLVLGPYVLMDAIGQGSMGQVYKALSKTDNQWYAVKVLPRRSMWNVRLARRQVRAFGQFTHPSVVPFVDVGTSGGLHYLVWPLAEGEPLESVVQREGKLTPEQTALYGLQVASGLASSQQNGLFHGLLKPSNIMIGTDGVARILDFGIGSLLVENEGESLVDTMSTANALTSGLDCASPESIMEPTNRTPAGDQYSLGCVLYYCLSGRYPFPEGSAVEKMMAHQFKQPTPIAELVPDAPPQLLEVLDKLMQKAAENRYTGCDELVEALKPIAPAMPAAAPARPAATGYGRSSAPGGGGLRPSDQGLSARPSYAAPAPPAAPAPVPGLPSRASMRGDRPGQVYAPPTPPVDEVPAYVPPEPAFSRSGAQPPGFIPESADERDEVGIAFFAVFAVLVAVITYVAGAFLLPLIQK
jgi:hypothetical protein